MATFSRLPEKYFTGSCCRMIDEILELKKRCNFGDEIGRSFNLTLGEVACISTVARFETLTSKDLAAYLDLSPSRGSRIVSGLITRGFIKGETDVHDRRYLALSLTESGEACYRQILDEKEACENRLLAQLTEEQKTAVRDGLHILLQVI